MSTNRLVTCPYDEAHKVKESRLQLHIAKCKRNHLTEEEKPVCPFNACHVLSKHEESYHLQHCPDRAAIDRKLCQNLDKNNPYKGRTAVPSYNESAPVITEELWDDEVETRGHGFSIPVEPPVGAILEPPPHSKPAERRKLYQELHRLPNERDSIKASPSVPVPEVSREPKQPTEASKVEMLRRQSAEQYKSLGLGRGRGAPTPPPPPSSRIAASFFNPDSSNQAPGVKSYSSAMSSGLGHVGLGRGQLDNRPGDPSAHVFDDSEDFPTLGCARGANYGSRNGVNGFGSRG